ncbi:MAG TPA: hypothetical protein VF021_07515, partial [Longimicrobiales bacterium]
MLRSIHALYRNVGALVVLLLLGSQPARAPIFIEVTESAKTEVVHASGDPLFDDAAEQFTL